MRYRLIEESRAHFVRAIEIDRRYPPAFVGLAETYLVEESDYDAGIEALEVAQSIVGPDSTVSILLASCSNDSTPNARRSPNPRPERD